MPTGRLPIEAAAPARATLQGRELVLWAGCDYLGLARDPLVQAAAQAGLVQYGLSTSGSRETTGNTCAHDELEPLLAAHLGLEAAHLVPDGYLSNLCLFQGLGSRVRRALVDKECHVSVRDALAACGIETRDYSLCSASAARDAAAGWDTDYSIVTDGCYPVMKGIAPLPALLELLPANGYLIVDDCHGFGVLGAQGRGTHEHHRVHDPRLIINGTLSKALGAFGGFVAGPQSIIELVRQRSHAYAGSTPVPPACVLAAHAGLRELINTATLPHGRLARLRANTERARAILRACGLAPHELPLPVFAFTLPTHDAMEQAYQRLLQLGMLVPYIHYPDSLGGYFRLAVSAAHTEPDFALLERGLREVLA